MSLESDSASSDDEGMPIDARAWARLEHVANERSTYFRRDPREFFAYTDDDLLGECERPCALHLSPSPSPSLPDSL